MKGRAELPGDRMGEFGHVKTTDAERRFRWSLWYREALDLGFSQADAREEADRRLAAKVRAEAETETFSHVGSGS